VAAVRPLDAVAVGLVGLAEDAKTSVPLAPVDRPARLQKEIAVEAFWPLDDVSSPLSLTPENRQAQCVEGASTKRLCVEPRSNPAPPPWNGRRWRCR